MSIFLGVDDGVLELDINGRGFLCFNPSDFNLYRRFCDLIEELPAIEKEYAAEIEKTSASREEGDIALVGRELAKAQGIDQKIKGKLQNVFGAGNDFDLLLSGVNLMAFGKNGERVITNLLNALSPFIEEGVQRHMRTAAANAVAKAEARRAEQ